jgi:hypothetical protein
MMRYLYALIVMSCAYANASHAQEQVLGTTVLDVTDTRPYIQAYDQSRVNVLPGGTVSWLYLYNESAAALTTAGTVSWIYVYDHGAVSVGPNSDVSHLNVLDEGSALVDGSTISHLGFFGSAIGKLCSGNIGYLRLSQAATVDVYGSDFQFDGYRLRGHWADGTEFNFSVQQSESPYLAPSPGPISLPANLILHSVPLPAGE